MRWPIVSRRRAEAALEAANADRERLRGERDQFLGDRNAAQAAMRTTARRLDEADAALASLHTENARLTKRVASLADTDGDRQVELEEQLAAVREELAAEKRRADRLQERLDDACGLSPDGIEDSGQWQPGYKPKPGGVS